MYAVIKTGGKQYKVSQGDVLRVEKLDVAEGDTVLFDQVLMIADGGEVHLGNPILEGKTVSASVKKHGRGKKIEVIKFKRRKHHRKQMGHRQSYTEIIITEIAGKNAAKPATSAKSTKSAGEKKASAKKSVTKKAVTKKPVAKKAASKKKSTSKKKTTSKSESK